MQGEQNNYAKEVTDNTEEQDETKQVFEGEEEYIEVNGEKQHRWRPKIPRPSLTVQAQVIGQAKI